MAILHAVGNVLVSKEEQQVKDSLGQIEKFQKEALKNKAHFFWEIFFQNFPIFKPQ